MKSNNYKVLTRQAAAVDASFQRSRHRRPITDQAIAFPGDMVIDDGDTFVAPVSGRLSDCLTSA